MEWNLKASSWDLAELDEPALPNIETVDGPSIFGVGVNRSKGEFSVDLKLGQVGNSGTDSSVPKWKDAGGVSKAVSSSSGSSKRARAINNGTQTVSCLVDGCNSDLSNCRDYHRRHKVCELHSKTPQVTIGGHKQRFCQQCSRFHSLEEFDEGKRSCRKRLDGHNRRRRKPQPEPLTRSGSFLSNYQGTQMLPFASTPVYPSTAVVNPGWSTGVVSSCADARLHHKQDLFLGSPPSSYKERKQIPFLQGDNATLNNQNPTLQVQAASVCHTHVRTSSLSERNKMMCDALTTPVPDSPCALSLLSSPHTHTPMAPEPHHTMSLMQPLGLSLHDNSLESVDPVLVSSGSDHCHPSMYNMGTHASQGNEPPQPLPFHWE